MAGKAEGARRDDGEAAALLAALLPGAEHEETHLSHVFLSGPDVYKLKKPRQLPFVDYRTVDQRRAGCLREIEVNRPYSPELYHGVVALTRDGDGARIGGDGPVVDWLVHMRRFGEENRGDRAFANGRVSDLQLRDFIDRLYHQHEGTPRLRTSDWDQVFADTAEGVANILGPSLGQEEHRSLTAWRLEIDASIAHDRRALHARGSRGLLRRCHGDLHAKNLCLLNDRLIAYDALEFDEELTQIDPLYDLAFLVGDLWHRGHRRQANLAANRYIAMSSDYHAFPLVPLYASLRCAVRAMAEAQAGKLDAARAYLDTAHAFVDGRPAGPSVLISGRSGSGKTTVAARLAPTIEPPPGAVHIRTDVVRKRRQGVLPETDLLPTSYTEQSRRDVYGFCKDAVASLTMRWPVLFDAAFAGDTPPDAGLLSLFDWRIWLDVPEVILADRLGAREADASDASAETMRGQRAAPPDESFVTIDAEGDPDEVVARVRTLITADAGAGEEPPYEPDREV